MLDIPSQNMAPSNGRCTFAGGNIYAGRVACRDLRQIPFDGCGSIYRRFAVRFRGLRAGGDG